MTEEEQRKEAADLLAQAARLSPGPTGTEAPSPAASAARGSLQGLTSGWSDEAAARIDQGISKIPGLRDVLPQDSKFPGLDDPTVTYEQRRDAYRAANDAARAANPKTYRANEVVGGLGQAAALAAMGGAAGALTRPLGTVTGAAAGGVLGGIAGAGYSEAETPGGVAKDTAVGGALGAATGAAGGYLANKVPKPVPEATDTQALGSMAKGKMKTEIAARREAIGAVNEAFPEVRAAYGDPEKLMSVSEAPVRQLEESRMSLMTEADAKTGGTPVTGVRDKLQALHSLAEKSQGPNGVSAPAVQKLVTSFDALAQGGDKIPTPALRKWVTDYLGPNALPSADSSVEVAKREVARIAKDGIMEHVTEQLGPAKAAELANTNKLYSGLIAVRDIAKKAGATAMTTAPKAAPLGTEADRIHAAIAGSAIEKPLYYGSRGAGKVAAATAQPTIDAATSALAGKHRDHLEGIADAAKSGDTQAVTQSLVQSIFGR